MALAGAAKLARTRRTRPWIFSTLRPCPIASRRVEALDDFLTRPSRAPWSTTSTRVDGDLLILGVAGKMGPTLARLAKRATPSRRVIGVARFSDAAVRDAPR